MSGRRENRSRSPVKVDNVGRRRDNLQKQESNRNQEIPNVINSMMMPNMFPQGNMMMGGMFNMMMPNPMLGAGMMPSAGVDMMSGTGMEMMQQPQVDMSAMATSAMAMQPGSAGPGQMDMSMVGGVMMEPNMMGMMGMNMGQEAVIEKKEIVLKYCTLTPPPPGTPPPPCRVRPPGCRTIFIGGLPDKIRESIVRDVFERYGRIQILRLSKKNFCHIRFDREACVDAAMTITGYHIKITNKDKDKKESEEDEDTNSRSGWLHIDYALSRDDQNEFERRQRQALRVQQQQMQQLTAQQEALAATTRAASYQHKTGPPRIQPYSTGAIVQLAEKIKSEEHFSTTLPTLIAWLERGECSKKNSTQFYSMIQTTNSHIRRLYNEKVQAEDEFLECKERIKNHIQSIIEQLEQVAKVFIAATHQRVWDHFTKPQRKNIETWQKMTQEFNSLKEEFSEKFLNEDGEYNGSNNRSNAMDVCDDESQDLKRENESLRFQLEAYKNEVEVIKADAQKEMDKFKAQFIARQALQTAMDKNPPLPSPIVKPPPPPPQPDDTAPAEFKEVVPAGCGEAKLIGVISAFLQVHPQGASLDYVVSYVRALFPATAHSAVHRVLQKHEDVFQQTTTGVGANIDNRWVFVAFDHPNRPLKQATN